ncbi:MAG TPA: hypothetical protein VN673_03720 [Clostridia bacterium]|nr:hypothetical protein [Clostridia bacterium]
MLTQLTTVKWRLAIVPEDTTQDEFLTHAIQAVSARFDRFCNRSFARATGAKHEFSARDLDVCVPCYPIETVTKWETKESEASGWVEQTGVEFVIRRGGVVSLASRLAPVMSQMARITYTGGYVLPGTTAGAGQTALPADLEDAAIEQVAFWYRHRDNMGLIRHWPSGGTYLVFTQEPLLLTVKQVLKKHERWVV